MDAATFRAVYPVFGDLIKYAPETVDYWLATARARLNPLVWQELLDEGLALFVAHKLSLATGVTAGTGTGLVSSKSIGGVSIAYNTEIGVLEGAGAYNLSAYGREFFQLARMVGMGSVQL